MAIGKMWQMPTLVVHTHSRASQIVDMPLCSLSQLQLAGCGLMPVAFKAELLLHAMAGMRLVLFRGDVLGGGSIALSRVGLHPGAAQDRVLCALRVPDILALFKFVPRIRRSFGLAAHGGSRLSSLLCPPPSVPADAAP